MQTSLTSVGSLEGSPETTGLRPTSTFKVIYAYSDNLAEHQGWLKVGDATLHTSKPLEKITEEDLREAARRRIDQYTRTADITCTVEHVELAVREVTTKEGFSRFEGFRDYSVHTVLRNSGYAKVSSRRDKSNSEWFAASVASVKAAVTAVKEGRSYISTSGVRASIELRPEQQECVNQALKALSGGTLETPAKMLWNAKMRFGKTLTSYALIDSLFKKSLAEGQDTFKVLVLTHRPAVNASWFEDFQKSSLEDTFTYGSKDNGSTFLEVDAQPRGIWFASIQDLRGSFGTKKELAEARRQGVALGFPQESSEAPRGEDRELLKLKNKELFDTSWDLIITDEAHEGTLTALAKLMYSELKAPRYLDLSGTPFNILGSDGWDDDELIERFSYGDNIFHWTYIDERRAKEEWTTKHGEEGNPYASLPEVCFVTYDVASAIGDLSSESSQASVYGFKLRELFATKRPSPDARPTFAHEAQVRALLNKMRGDERYNSEDAAHFPFHDSFSGYFDHTLWMLPSVDACTAMEDLLGLHSSGFLGVKVVNATGRGTDSWGEEKRALEAVQKTIASHSKTITLTQQMLTTGVTVPEWTAVFMMSDTTDAKLYMQTAFRGASPGSLPNGQAKDRAYVFDFNPERCLARIVDVAKVSVEPSDDAVAQGEAERAAVATYLKYLSVLTLDGGHFVAPNSEEIFKTLNDAYVNEVFGSGFQSPRLFSAQRLLTFDIQRREVINALNRLQGGKAKQDVTLVTQISSQDKARLEELKAQAKDRSQPPLTPDEKQEKTDLEKAAKGKKEEDRKNRKNAISILAGIAARMPMMIYAGSAGEKITLKTFAQSIDDESWREFMPKNLLRVMPPGTKSLQERQEEALSIEGNVLYWDDVAQFFDPVIFELSAERIRTKARAIATMDPLRRLFYTALLFSFFRNTDKETVLTPYLVVELHYTKTLGGLMLLDHEASTSEVSMVRVKNLETGVLEAHPMLKVETLLEEGTHELAPVWVTPPSEDMNDFWENSSTTLLDLNSKTALYPLFGATSLFYKQNERRLHTMTLARKLNEFRSIVEEQIFVNCRVPYSAMVARRVLGGTESGVEVNDSVVDVIAVKRHLESNQICGKRSELDKIWGWLFDVSSYDDVETRRDRLMAMNNKIDLKLLLGEIENVNTRRFAAVVSNPPYQIQKTEDANNTTTMNVFHYFYEIASLISHRLSMVFPGGRWMQRSGASGGIADIIMPTFDTVKWYRNGDEKEGREIFPQARIRDGVSIVTANMDNICSTVDWCGTILPRPTSQTLYPLDGSMVEIIKKITVWGVAKSRKESSNSFGLDSQFVEMNPSRVMRTDDPDSSSFNHEAVRGLLADDAKGSGKTVREYLVARDAVNWTPRRLTLFSSWKVTGGQAGSGKDPEYENYKIVPDDYVVGGSQFIVGHFSTKEEAEHYVSLLDTKLARRALRESKGGKLVQWGAFVPDLGDYTDSNPDIDWSQPLDPQLYKLFNLTEEEIKIIEGDSE